MDNMELNSILLNIGKSYVGRLKDFAIKESIRREKHVKTADIVKEALEKAFPEIFRVEVKGL